MGPLPVRAVEAGPARVRLQNSLQKLLFGFSSRLAAVRISLMWEMDLESCSL